MRDFVSGFVSGLAGGVVQGYKIGSDIADRREKTKYLQTEATRKAAADTARDVREREKIAATKSHYGAMESAAAANAATNKARARTYAASVGNTDRHNKLMEIVADRNAGANERRAAAAELKASGIDPGLEAHLAGSVPNYTPKTATGGAVATPPAGTAPVAAAPEEPPPEEDSVIDWFPLEGTEE